MGDLVQFPMAQSSTLDGGKARIKRGRARRNLAEPFTGDETDNLIMDHADPEACDQNFKFTPSPCDVA